jgi:hypothetical protein
MFGYNAGMGWTIRWIAAMSIFAAGAAQAQQQQQGGPPAQPALSACGTLNPSVEIICGTHSPEDLELTPDGKYLIVSQFVNGRGGNAGAGLVLFDLSQKSFTKIPITAEPRKDWGDPTCPGAPGQALVPHGISLSKRSSGGLELYVVNHGGRQSMEMYELRHASGGWDLVWHGCVVSMQEYNDVAALPDGGFIATQPTALRRPGDASNVLGGQATGYVARWTPGKGETELPGTRTGYPNGVLVSADGRWMFYNAWTARQIHKYDLKAQKDFALITVDFMPDNLTWTSDKQMLSAGVKGANGNCPAGSNRPCIQGFGVVEIDPLSMVLRPVFDSESGPAMISGVSVALEVGNSVYLGAFQGDRLVKITLKKNALRKKK